MKLMIRKKYRSQKGQAITELVVGILGLALVMIGVLVVALLGMQSIRNTVQARTLADEYSVKGLPKGNARFIEEWNGSRSVVLYGSGTAQFGSQLDPGAFTEELSDNQNQFRVHYLGTKAPYAQNSFVFPESNLMVHASNLTFGSSVKNDILQEYRHFDASAILQALRLPSVFTLHEQIAMPLNPR